MPPSTSKQEVVKSPIKYEIAGTKGNAFLKFFMKPGDVILADGGSMCYMDDSISMTISKPKKGGALKWLKKVLAGESLFQSYFVAGPSTTKASVLALSTPLPGDIVAIPLKVGEGWTLSSGSFLAATENVEVSGMFKFNGIISWGNDENMFRTKVKAKNGDGVVWVETYGHIEKHILKAGEGLKVDNEGFVACKEEINYSLAKAGKSLFGSYFSNEGLVMHFKGPAIVYTQSKGIKALADRLGTLIHKGESSKGSKSVLPNVDFSIDF